MYPNEREKITKLINKGYSNDFIYQILAGEYKLFGIAFFGHKGKPGDKKILTRLWKQILKIRLYHE